MDSHGGSGDSEPKRKLSSHPAFKRLRRLLGTLPDDRKDAALDTLRGRDEKTKEAKDIGGSAETGT